MVATVHDLAFLDRPEDSSRRGRSFFPRAWAATRDRAQLIVCPSQVVADDCHRRGVARDRLRVIPWGVSAPASAPEAGDTVRRARGLPDPFVLWVGTLEPRKNLPRLVEAMVRLPQVHLAVVGPRGWNIDGADVLEPLGDRAHRLGFVDDHDLSALYRAASVFAYPSVAEGFGLPVLEAMAHGTPVVTAQATATAEVAAGAARLVDPDDPDSIAAAIDATLTEPETTEQLVALGRERAAELTWARTAEQYASVLCEAASVGHSG
jgi:glycosyltransferase involved in cell wall biosynthesis